jgi:hypothetical protein
LKDRADTIETVNVVDEVLRLFEKLSPEKGFEITPPEGDMASVTLVRPSMIAGMLPDSGLGCLAAEVEDRFRGILDEIG